MRISREEKNARSREANRRRVSGAMKRAIVDARLVDLPGEAHLFPQGFAVFGTMQMMRALERRELASLVKMDELKGGWAAVLRWEGLELRQQLLATLWAPQTFAPPTSPASSPSDQGGREAEGELMAITQNTGGERE